MLNYIKLFNEFYLLLFVKNNFFFKNIGEACLFLKIKSAIKTQSVQRISDFIDRLTNDHNRFVPADGNVHHVTSSTLNFLKLLTQNRPVIGYIYEDNNTSQNTKMNISKLFG